MKFQIGDIIVDKDYPNRPKEIVDIIRYPGTLYSGNWANGQKTIYIQKDSYILRNLKTNKLSWGSFWHVDDFFELVQPKQEEPQEEDSHQGMIYNPITNKWSWL